LCQRTPAQEKEISFQSKETTWKEKRSIIYGRRFQNGKHKVSPSGPGRENIFPAYGKTAEPGTAGNNTEHQPGRCLQMGTESVNPKHRNAVGAG